MKKIGIFLLCLALSAAALTGCDRKKMPAGDAEKLSIVVTGFPAYDWVRNIMGDAAERAEISMLSNNGADLHSFQPTTEDIVKIASCGLFIYVGGESGSWAERALQEDIGQGRSSTCWRCWRTA